MTFKTIVILPAYNEEKTIGSLLEEIRRTLKKERNYKIIVVNDGSKDNTQPVVERFFSQLPLQLINHPTNRGLAEALRSGFKAALAEVEPEGIIVTLDADNTHPPSLILKMASVINNGYDLVIASRYIPGARVFGLSYFRKVCSLGASLLVRGLFRVKGVKDFTCGYRAYRARLLKLAFKFYGQNFITQTGFSCMLDILLKLRIFKPRFKEVPLLLRYDLKKSESKLRVATTILETLLLLLRRRILGVRLR
jgi:dolichol-phosphate mannosyltransferase